MTRAAPLRITKSAFLLGRQCPKRFWLLAQGIEEPEPVPPADPFPADEWQRVEQMAEKLFPGCHRVGGGPSQRAANSRAAMAHGTVAQAEFADLDLLAVVDILERRTDGWFVWEVKASTTDPKEPEVKPLFDWDLAFQWHVLAATGVDVRGAGVVMLRKDYVRGDTAPGAGDLLIRVDRTESVRQRLPDVAAQIERLRAVAAGDEPNEWPQARCSANRDAASGDRPSDCGHLLPAGRCGRELPENWAGNLPRLLGRLAERVHAVPNRDMRDLPIDDSEWKWSKVQRRVIECAKSGEPFIDRVALRAGLDEIRWPVAYVDFEFDNQAAIPRWPGYRPYDSIPFQWALCVQQKPDATLGPTSSFLHESDTDPRLAFAESLLSNLPSGGSVVVHHVGAEKTVMNRLAAFLGGEAAVQLAAVVERLFDTEKIAKDGYYHLDQQGSWSIKALAPCLTGRGYEDLEIQHGMAAVVAWRKLLLTAPGSPERAELRGWLQDYCGRDAVLMHEILQRLRVLAGAEGHMAS